VGLLLVVVVHAANVQDSEGAKLVLRRALGLFPRLRLIWADQGYTAHFVAWAQTVTGWVIDLVARPAGTKGFQVLPRRWVAGARWARTFAWLGRSRRLSKDYEGVPETSEAWVQVAMIHLMLKRLAPP